MTATGSKRHGVCINMEKGMIRGICKKTAVCKAQDTASEVQYAYEYRYISRLDPRNLEGKGNFDRISLT
jgi:hypothetical protein